MQSLPCTSELHFHRQNLTHLHGWPGRDALSSVLQTSRPSPGEAVALGARQGGRCSECGRRVGARVLMARAVWLEEAACSPRAWLCSHFSEGLVSDGGTTQAWGLWAVLDRSADRVCRLLLPLPGQGSRAQPPRPRWGAVRPSLWGIGRAVSREGLGLGSGPQRGGTRSSTESEPWSWGWALAHTGRSRGVTAGSRRCPAPLSG